jgi:predicted TIM-barrel fold metal-dependent hydrolase
MSAVGALVDTLGLVDHHCHGVVRTDLDRPAFEALLSEGGPPAPGMTNFDTPVGLAVRRHCAPLLDLEPHADPETYLARRAELGAAEVTRRLLGATGTAAYLVDTGWRGAELLTPEEIAAATGAGARHVVRLESVAEDLAARGVDPADFAARFADLLTETATQTRSVGVKSVAAYRVGLDFDPRPPAAEEVAAAAADWLNRPGVSRVDSPVLIRALLWTAVELGLPIQFHVAFGDADIRLHRTNPALLTDFIRAVPQQVPIMLLHCYPYQREASYLAAIYPHVYLDVGVSLNFVGPVRAAEVLAEAMEVAPFTKVLYSSDAFGLAELYHLGAHIFRRALGDLLTARVADGEWSAADAIRVARLLAAGNATRVYGLPEADG